MDARGGSERKKYISRLGHLYPERYESLNQAQTFDALKEALRSTPYYDMMNRVSQENDNEVESNGQTIGKFITNFNPV